MPNLSEALNLLGYNEIQSRSITQIFHIMGIFDDQPQMDFLNEENLNKKLKSNLGLTGDCTNLDIAIKFNELGQKLFRKLRGKSTERQQMQSLTSFNPEIITHFKNLDLFQEIIPEKNCDIFFIFGASEAGLRNRINFLKESIGETLDSKAIIFLGGDRKLWPKYSGSDPELLQKINGEDATYKLIQKLNPDINVEELKTNINEFFESNKEKLLENKIDIGTLRMQIISDRTHINWPNESDLEKYLAEEILNIKDVKVIEGKIDQDIKRPTTETTIAAIQNDDTLIFPSMANPKVGFISSQPFIRRQTELAKLLSGFSDVHGYGRGSNSISSSDISVPMEALLGEVNSLSQIASKKSKPLSVFSAPNFATSSSGVARL